MISFIKKYVLKIKLDVGFKLKKLVEEPVLALIFTGEPFLKV
jgi:hypothetical protein